MDKTPGPIARQAAARARAAAKTSEEMLAIRADRAAAKAKVDTLKEAEEGIRRAKQMADDLVASEGFFRTSARHHAGPWMYLMSAIDGLRAQMDAITAEVTSLKTTSEAKPARKRTEAVTP